MNTSSGFTCFIQKADYFQKLQSLYKGKQTLRNPSFLNKLKAILHKQSMNKSPGFTCFIRKERIFIFSPNRFRYNEYVKDARVFREACDKMPRHTVETL